MVTGGDPILNIFAAYRAYMQERTGATWDLIERMLDADRSFWRDRPEAWALVKSRRAEEDDAEDGLTGNTPLG